MNSSTIFYEQENKAKLVPTYRLLSRNFMKNKIQLSKHYLYNIMTIIISLYCNGTNSFVLLALLLRKNRSEKNKLGQFKISQKYFAK